MGATARLGHSGMLSHSTAHLFSTNTHIFKEVRAALTRVFQKCCQNGVVGDGDNKMEDFDKTTVVKERRATSNAIGGTESKKTQKNVFGYSTG